MYYMTDGFENGVREMITFELGKKIEKDAFWESDTLDVQLIGSYIVFHWVCYYYQLF